MALQIYNSLTKKKELFVPLEPGKVKMYVCGPTVYDEPHIGHLRSAYVFEVMRNYLEYSGHGVRFVRNVTDVDDKIIEKAKEAGIRTEEVSSKYYQSYKDELKAFGIREPDEEPRATGHIGEMIALIQKLIERGMAYSKDGDVYFRVGAFKDYGKLSGQKTESMLENVRIDPNEKKENPLDFALWKKSKEGEPSWPSPWGPGRPGWHIECSAMSMGCLKSETIDIHGGGRDLIFPHHENEIAQSESATGKKFVNFWVHHGLVTIDNQKMSKSLVNYVTLGQVRSKGSRAVEELKFLFLGTHYSMPVDYSDGKMQMEKSIRSKFVNYLMSGANFKGYQAAADDQLKEYEILFNEAMDDDFNTPQALAVMHEMVNYAWKCDKISVRLATAEKLKKIANLFNLSFTDAYPNPEVLRISDEISSLISKRQIAKQDKDFKLADLIRREILEKYKLALVDDKDGSTHWVRVE